MKFTTPTPVQAEAIPPALDGRDILGSAQTGTGKTGAFAIPMVQSLLNNPRGSALILTPTRELARQVMEMVAQLAGRNNNLKAAFLIGGEPMGKQFTQLRANPRIIVGTPGRINDHLERGSLKLHDAGFLVLDETDRMLDMGFGIQLERIFKYLPAKRQTLMFSATLPKGIVKLSENYLNNPVRVAIGATNNVADKIKQDVIRLSEDEKYDELVRQLDDRSGSVIIFVKTKFGTERLAKRLARENHSTDAIHGDLRQTKRDRVIRDFRSKNYRILVATDIAARGLDIPHIEHVINYDLPQVPEDYIHRIGRTARAGAEGSSLCLITPADGRKWREIEQLMNPQAQNTDRPPAQRNRSGRGNSSRNNGFRTDARADGGRNNGPRTEARADGGRNNGFRTDARADGGRNNGPRTEVRADGGRNSGPRTDARTDNSRNNKGKPEQGRPDAQKRRFNANRSGKPGGGGAPRQRSAA
ncbi:MAG: DEAD/DEAH box helicase [Alphaproteobacteria bacterium]|nr:DEAD/DEAH box helicase [Alphaproteobacteria bacterium]